MAKTLMQFRYFGEGSNLNYPSEINLNNLANGSIFTKYGSHIVKLGIQALPGTMIHINGSQLPLIIGSTGIFQVELDDASAIKTISVDLSNQNQSYGIIFDVVFGGSAA